MTAIKTIDLTKYYGSARGVEGLNLEVSRGEIFGFIGPNGAGKSTTIRLLMQFLRPTAGRISLLGTKITGDHPELRRRVGYLPTEINYYRTLTGRQILQFAARAHGVRDLKPAHEWAERLDLDLSKTIRSYSMGNRKKLAIVQMLLHDPELLILDEPTTGLDPLIQNRFLEILRERNERGATIFLSTHVLSEVEKICQRVGFIKDGRLVRVSKVAEIPGREERLIEVRFAEPGDLIERCGFRRIDPRVFYEGGVHVFHARRHLHEVLRQVADHPIEDIAVRRPTLEELFLKLYAKEGE